MTYLTKQGLQKYKNELEQLNKDLPALIKETGVMAALGDRSENAGYINAKANMRRAQARIRYLEHLVKKATVITPSSKDKINIGSKVTLQDLNDNSKVVYTIVDSIEANPINGFISFHSPLGKLLIDKSEGETITLETPVFKTQYKILKIS